MTKNYLFTTLTVIFIGLSTTFAQNLNTNLLVHYPFDGNANDASVNGLDGISNATLTADRFGNPNSAYSFNGIDQFIDLPISPLLESQLPITLSCWVKFDVIDNSKTVIATTDFAIDNHSGAWINTDNAGHFAGNYGDDTGNTSSPNRRTKSGATSLNSNTWHHVIAIMRGPEDMDLYINCRNDEGTYSGNGGMIAYTSAPGSIGRKDSNNGGPTSYFQGVLDDFRYWSRALNQEEIYELCQFDLSANEYGAINEFIFSVFPNPANNQISLSSSQPNIINNYKITSLDGKIVKSSSYEKTVDLTGIASGLYTLNLFDSNGVSLGFKKIIIN